MFFTAWMQGFCSRQSCSEELVQDIWFCGICTVSPFLRNLVTVYGFLESMHSTLCLEPAVVYRPRSQRTFYEGRMTKVSAKERGKGPGRGKGRPAGGQRETSKDRDNVPSKDGDSGSETERLRRRILEADGMTLSDTEASGSGR